VFVMNADGSNPVDISNAKGKESHPAWSPDGTKIAYSSNSAAGQHIWVMNANGSGQTDLTPTATATETWPSWSPDGTQIAFESNGSGNDDVWVMNASGSGQIDITNNPASDDAPDWGAI